MTNDADERPMTSTCDEYRCPCHEKAIELQKFKDWVHAWLDGQGVPHDPYPEETKQHGCRVGGRMKWLVANKFKE
jgi:hypothetical protein